MADPYVIAAGGLVLLGLGCFGNDLYNAAAPAKDQPTGQQWAAEAVNIAADAAAVVAVLTTVNNYYVAADNYVNERAAVSEEPKRGFSPILYVLAAVEALELLTGFGTPYRGDDLKEGAKQFTALGEQLQDTVPNSSWRSSAAQIYVDGVQAGTDAAAIIAQIDAGLADLADHCADFVIYLRLAFGGTAQARGRTRHHSDLPVQAGHVRIGSQCGMPLVLVGRGQPIRALWAPTPSGDVRGPQAGRAPALIGVSVPRLGNPHL